ncbi:MAG TPA: hypothetical protein VGM56_32710 [Byssovorax sp.]
MIVNLVSDDDRLDDYGGEHDREGRPIVAISADLYENTNAAVAALGADPDLYCRDAVLVHVVRLDDDDAADRRAPMAAVTPIMRSLARATLTERLARFASFVKYDGRKKQDVEVLPPETLVAAVDARGEWPGLRALAGILETPSMRPDGTLIETPGYDRATRYLYMPSADYLPVPRAPTQTQASAALAELLEVFEDFPFASQPQRLVPVAALLSMIARPMIAGAVPGFLFDATTAGSGKSLEVDAATMVASGRAAARMTWPVDDAELEKVLGAYALRGANSIVFDNVDRAFHGGPLEKVLTAWPLVELRILGKSKIPTMRWRAVVMASGNNLVVQGDTARRVLVARLEPDGPRPQDRSDFKHPRLLAWVAAERPRLVRAALTLLRAWTIAGRPTPLRATWGSFEVWASIVPELLAWAGGPNVMEAQLSADDAARADPLLSALPAIFDVMEHLDGGFGVTVKELVSACYNTTEFGRAVHSPHHAEAAAALDVLGKAKPGQLPDPARVGYALRAARGRWLADGRKVDHATTKANTGVRWQVTKRAVGG